MYEIVKNENNEVEVKITVESKDWNEYVEKAYQANKGKFNIQGFRKGAAPRKIIEKNYGSGVFYDEALDMAFADEYGKFLSENTGLEIIDQPTLEVNKFDESGLVLTAKAPLLPEVKLGDYKGLTVEKYVENVDEAKIEKELKQAQERGARFVEAPNGTEAKLGDFVTIDFTGSVDGKEFEGGKAENYRLELGSHSFIDNFEDQIVGMKVGEERDINVTFPEDYPAEDLKGKASVFKIVLHKIENKELPELNDEFASNISEFETLEDYKSDLRKHMQETANEHAKRENENRLIAKVVENSTVEIPAVLIERQLDMFIRDFEMRLSYQGLDIATYCKYVNTTPEDLRASYKPQAENAVKTRLVLEKLITTESIIVSDEELDSRLSKDAEKYKKTLDEYKKSINAQNLAYIKNDLLMDKVIDFLTKNNTLA
ncbi:MAG: trigger factor [Clostridiales bacterium]|nr:trigger factor [Clostridiales bacterium]